MKTYTQFIEEGKKGLWDNIHAKRKRGERPARKGEKDYPKTLNVEHNDGSSKNCKKGEYFCKKEHECKPIPEGHHVMPNGDLMKDSDHKDVKEEKKNCGCGKDPCITYGKKKKVDEGAAWQRKEGKNKEGGLNEKGRKSYERENPGSDLKAPQPEGGPRKRSFCARMGGVKGPMKKDGKPTRKALALRKWKC